MRLGPLLACAIVVGGLERPTVAAVPVDFPPEAYEFFEQRVRPLLVERCYECHSSVSGKNRGGLALDSRLAILTGGDNGPAVVPGEPETSLLVAAIRYESELAKMPPTGKLSDDEIAILVHWIKLGAPADDAAAAAASHEIDFDSGRDFWSFQPLARAPLPPVSTPLWPRTRVDRFILASLDGLSLAPSEPADRRTLVRRIYFDLVGLPPTPDEVERFVADERPDAYERLVDRLLASPHHGERWGRYWLDLVRYVDATANWLNDLSTAWLYRDWVVAALNRDLPFDLFVKQQFAADLLPGAVPADTAALGLLGLSPTYHKELKLDKEVIKSIVANEWEERVDMVSRVFLGLTMACARCHDHKFDPISTQDYYALAGVFASTRLVRRPIIAEPAASVAQQAHDLVASLSARIAELEKEAEMTVEDRQQAEELKDLVTRISRLVPNYDTPTVPAVDDAAVFVLADGPNRTQIRYAPGVPMDLPLHQRGNPSTPGEIVPRRFLTVLSPDPPPVFTSGSGRLELAESIVGPQGGPLAARVIVNRIWMNHFGRGIVETPSNFGAQGSRPTHPQLLEDLTAGFVEQGWSLKWLHRRIVLSGTYRQAGTYREAAFAADPAGRWLWRMPRRRLDVEAWRDTMLCVSGRLQPGLGGPPRPLDEPDNRRRTLYGLVHRHELENMLRLYDFPDPSAHSPLREPTTTPLQQLFVLNSDFVSSQSEALAARVVAQSGGDSAAAVRSAYLLAFGRPATDDQVSLALAFLQGGLAGDHAGVDQAGGGQANNDLWRQYMQVLLGSNEFMFVD